MSPEGGSRAELERAPGLVGEEPVDVCGLLRFTHRLTECSFELIKRPVEETIHNRHGILVQSRNQKHSECSKCEPSPAW